MKNKKRIAARILKTSPGKIRFAADATEEIKKAITRSDFRGLIAVKKIFKSNQNQHSRSGARKTAYQKRKGRRKGKGSKKGSMYSVVSKKRKWIARIRAQRSLLKELRDNEMISKKTYQMLCAKSKGGFFRNRRHIKLYLREQNLIER